MFDWRTVPLNATVEKQNCGVREGGGDGWAIISRGAGLGGFGASAVEDFFQRKEASMTVVNSECP